MKRFLLFVCVLVPFLSAQAQGGIEGGFYAEHFQLGYRSQQSFGGILHYPISDRFTLNYQIGIGPAQGGGIYIHAPAVAVAGAFLLSQAADVRALGALGALALVIPEGVGMYVGNGKLKPHISINPLGCDYWHRRDPYEEFTKMSCSMIVRFKMRTNLSVPVYVAPQIGGVFVYTPGELTERFGFRAGIAIGFDGGPVD